jgi:putative membrane-bound dehydrogenase-like protein
MKPEIPTIAITFFALAIGFSPAQEIYDSQPETLARMSPGDVAAAAKLPEGFRMQVAAAEPMVQQPISMAWDTKGRLWVAENNTYAESAKRLDLDLNDRIVILEDTDKDGDFDKRTIFHDKLKQLTSIEVIDGGVFALAPPHLYFFPDANRDDAPDGLPQILASGFNTNIRHNFANGLRFGPDGWLYGRHGILGASDVIAQDRMSTDLVGYPTRPADRPLPRFPPPGGYGIPGTIAFAPGMSPVMPPTRLTCGVWRYDPQSQVIEMVCEGTTNPWGMDWDAHGNLFFINTVIGHLWHAIPGSHLQRMYGEDSDPFAYELLPHIADHVHWDSNGEDWRETRKGPPSSGTDQAGGGHAHSGMMIYQADQWPVEYRNHLFTLNLHGRRINREQLDRVGAGFVGRHQPDMVFWSDPWFRGIELSTAPDGTVYVLDWSDIGECHEDDGVHRTSGRIYRIAHESPIAQDASRSLFSSEVLAGKQSSKTVISHSNCVKILQHPNIWYARELWKGLQFNRLSLDENKELYDLALRPKKPNGESAPPTVDPITLQLRALWTLHASNRLREDHLFRILQTKQHESVHAWAIRLIADRLDYMAEAKQTEAEAEIVDMLASKPITEISSLVRLYTAALLPKFTNQQWRIAGMLIKSEDLASDRDFPLVFWYGTKNLLADNPMRAARMAAESLIPKVNELYLRRFAAEGKDAEEATSFLVSNAGQRDNAAWHAAAVNGLWEALRGRTRIAEPTAWKQLAVRAAAHPDLEIREKGILLHAVFGGNDSSQALIELAESSQSTPSSRRAAIESLGRIDDASAREVLWHMVADPNLGGIAADSLGTNLSADDANRLLGMYADAPPASKSGIIVAMGKRRDSLPILLDAIDRKVIPSANIDAATWRQFALLADSDLLNRAKTINPAIGVTADQERTIQEWEQDFSNERLVRADASNGRARWNTLCAQCHKLFGEGGANGPELTGAQRSNLRYWLENVLSPSAIVAENYRVTAFQTADGRVVTGVPLTETEDAITIQTATEKVTLEKPEIVQRKPSSLSLMPSGILDPLSEQERADLLKYLMSPVQVPAK